MTCLLPAAACLLSGLAAAETGGWGILIDTATVAAHRDDPGWVVVDCRSRGEYAAGHIPGAVSLDQRTCRLSFKFAPSPRDPKRNISKLMSAADLERFLGRAGISRETHVVLYASSASVVSAAVAFWALEYLGAKRVRFLNGGIETWTAAGRPLETAAAGRPAAVFKARVDPRRLATTPEMLAVAEGRKQGVQIIDSRSPDEYKGLWLRARRGGRIPRTTRSVPYYTTFSLENGRIRPRQLGTLFGGLDPSRRTIAVCHGGFRSALIYMELRMLGFKDPANYFDGWMTYADHMDYPVDDESFAEFDGAADPREVPQQLR